MIKNFKSAVSKLTKIHGNTNALANAWEVGRNTLLGWLKQKNSSYKQFFSCLEKARKELRLTKAQAWDAFIRSTIDERE